MADGEMCYAENIEYGVQKVTVEDWFLSIHWSGKPLLVT